MLDTMNNIMIYIYILQQIGFNKYFWQSWWNFCSYTSILFECYHCVFFTDIKYGHLWEELPAGAELIPQSGDEICDRELLPRRLHWWPQSRVYLDGQVGMRPAGLGGDSGMGGALAPTGCLLRNTNVPPTGMGFCPARLPVDMKGFLTSVRRPLARLPTGPLPWYDRRKSYHRGSPASPPNIPVWRSITLIFTPWRTGWPYALSLATWWQISEAGKSSGWATKYFSWSRNVRRSSAVICIPQWQHWRRLLWPSQF